jgi:hypothetical protein
MEDTAQTYDALCIDTCIYEAQGMAFDKGLLKQLDQFLESPIALLVPEIVHFELQGHVTKRIKDARTKVARAIRVATDELCVDEESLRQVEHLLLGSGDLSAEKRLSDFYSKTGAVAVGSLSVVVSQLVEMYFSSKPPFENSGKKKAEFPDAIALLAVEAWAKERKGKVMIVSTDAGWRDFCAASEWLFIAEGLGEALAHFQPHNLAATLIRQLRSRILAKDNSEILQDISDEIARFVERAVPEVEATSSYALDEQYVEAAYVSHDFHRGPNNEPEINLVRVHSDGVVLQMTASVCYEVTAQFALSVFDSIDREYLPLQKRKVSTTATFDADIVVKVLGDFHRGLSEVEVEEVEIEGTLDPIDLGDIDPDPERDEWDKEKYTY